MKARGRAVGHAGSFCDPEAQPMADTWNTLAPVLAGGGIAAGAGLLTAIVTDRLGRTRTKLDERTKRGFTKAEELLELLNEVPLGQKGESVQVAEPRRQQVAVLLEYLPDAELRKRFRRIVDVLDNWILPAAAREAGAPSELIRAKYLHDAQQNLAAFLRSEPLPKRPELLVALDQAFQRVHDDLGADAEAYYSDGGWPLTVEGVRRSLGRRPPATVTSEGPES
jgi:hypothetical protein